MLLKEICNSWLIRKLTDCRFGVQLDGYGERDQGGREEGRREGGGEGGKKENLILYDPNNLITLYI